MGPLFATLCCFVWCVYVALEVRDAVNIMRSAVHLKGPCTIISAASGKLKITSLGPMRIAFFLTVQTVRVGIAVALLVGGQHFLVGTFDMSNLLLNCVALAFVQTFMPT